MTLEKENVEISGFKMYDLGPYPFVIKTDDPKDKIIVDIFSLDDNTNLNIENMELGAGYQKETIILNNEPITIYTFKQNVAHATHITTGNWKTR